MIQESIKKALEQGLGIKKGEKVLVITDKNLIEIGKLFYKEAKKITESELIEIPIGKVHGEEPPSETYNKMKEFDIIIAATTKSLTHTKALRESGARGASMPTITKEMIKRALNVDYNEMAKRCHKLKEKLDHGKKVHVTTEAGTDITFSIEGRKAHAGTGIITKGTIGNLPGGETYIAPLEGTADGIIMIDGSVLDKKINQPIKIIMEKGFAVEIFGKEGEKLKNALKKVEKKEAYNLAELGIGTNDQAELTGNTLEDEKKLGTCHFAFGNNKGFGGKTDVEIHIDAILIKPTIYIDDKVIMKKGELL